MANVTAQTLRPSKAPNLPIAPVEYSQQYQDQFSNALRLYFNQIDNFNASAGGSNGGQYIQFPHIAASDGNSQYTTSNTATVTLWNSLDTGSGFTLNSNSTATCEYSGVYKIDYSLQFANTDNAQHNVDVWLKINNSNLANSATTFTLVSRKTSSIYSYICAYSHVTFKVNAGDVIGLYWATDQASNANNSVQGVFMQALPAITSPYSRPASPSAVGTIAFVSAPTS